MALIDCPECAARVSDKAGNCPHCGFPIRNDLQPALQQVQPLGAGYVSPKSDMASGPAPLQVAKSRGVYIILGILFGGFGFHNFYSGHNVSGGIKFGLVMVAFALDASTHFYSAFSLVALVIFELWALVEIMVVSTDAAGNKMS